jgi:hypothetical protein
MIDIARPPTIDCTNAANAGIDDFLPQPNKEGANQQAEDGSSGKVMLPRRIGEPRFGPQSYYYEASRTGVVPSGSSAANVEERPI